MKLKILGNRRALMLALALGLVAQSGYAQSDPTEALLTQRLQSLEALLQLDASQSADVARIQQSGFYQMALVVEELRVATGRLERLRMAQDLAGIRQVTRDRMAEILSPAQLAKFDAFVAEETQAFRSQLGNQ